MVSLGIIRLFMERTYFEWDDNFLTGNDEIDGQHFKLVEMINELLQVSLNFKNVNIDDVISIKNRLSDYVVIHFADEEKIMEQYKIKQSIVDDHKAVHKDFVKNINGFFDNEEAYDSEEKVAGIAEFLIRWLAYHILNIDKSLVRQIKNIETNSMTPDEAHLIEAQLDESSTEPLLKALRVLYSLVSQKNKEIEKKNSELEERVLERTKELEEANARLIEMSFLDELTGLYNRRYVMKEIEKFIYEWKRYKTPFSLLYIDVDNFKMVNDQFGHNKGDAVLIWLAKALKKNIRMNDTACRIGGDEFIILCTHANLEEAIRVGNKLEIVSRTTPSGELSFWQPSISIGIATIDDTVTSASELLNKADKAMYDAKSHGGGQFKY